MTLRLVVLCALFAIHAIGDGVSVLARGTAGPWLVTVFAPEKPLRAGETDLSILVQDPHTGEAVRDVEVAMTIQSEWIRFQHPATGNRILYAARAVLRASSEIPAYIRIRRGGEKAILRCSFRVASMKESSASYVLCFALVPAGLLLGWRRVKRQSGLRLRK